jgi:hypothetical protein
MIVAGIIILIVGVFMFASPDTALNIAFELGINIAQPVITGFGKPLLWGQNALESTKMMGLCIGVIGLSLLGGGLSRLRKKK